MTFETKYGTGQERIEKMYHSSTPGGVVIDPLPLTEGEVITILYTGMLAQNGAQAVYLHAGYGYSDNWNNLIDEKMSRTGWGFVKTLELKDSSRLNLCFRDNAGNWDNNGGLNWSFEIHNGDRY